MIKETIVIDVKTGSAVKEVDKLNKSIDKTSKTSKKTGASLKGGFQGLKTAILSAVPALGKLKTALISTGVGAFVVAIGSLITLFTKVVSTSADFGKALATLKAITNATSNEMEFFTEQAKELGSTTQFTASQVVNLQTELAKLGFTARDIGNATPAILDLAASLDVSLAEAAEFAGSVVRSFGLDTEETSRVVDVMAKSTSSSALNFESLRESMKLAAPTSRALGVSVEKTAALLGVLADTGLKGSIAGTGLSKTFVALNQKGLTLEEGLNKVKNSSNQLNTAIDLVGIVGAKSLLNLANAGEKIENLEETFNNAAGAAKRIAETRLDTLEGDTKALSSAWEGFLLNIDDGDGAINSIARGSVQLLRKAIVGLQVGVDFLAFTWEDGWSGISNYTKSITEITSGYFSKFGAKIKMFANESLLAISEIPYIGKSVDTEQVKKNIEDASKVLDDANKKIAQGQKKYREQVQRDETFMERFQAEQTRKTKLLNQKKLAKQQAEEQEKIDEEALEKQREAEAKAKAEREKAEKDFVKFKDKLKKDQDDKDAETEVQKNELERKRRLEELKKIKLSEEEKRQAVIDVNAYYDELEEEARKKDTENAIAAKNEENAKIKALNDKKLQDEITQIQEEEKNRQKQYAVVGNAIGNLQNIFAAFGKESKALAIAGIVTEQVASISKIISNTGIANAKAVAISPLTLGQPWVGINSVSAGLSIAGSVAGAAKSIADLKSNKKTPSMGRVSSGVRGAAPTTAPQTPSFNIVGQGGTNQLAEAIGSQSQQPIKAYVVSNDVTTAQSLDRNIVESASL